MYDKGKKTLMVPLMYKCCYSAMETCCYVVNVSAVELGQSSESGWIYTSVGKSVPTCCCYQVLVTLHHNC